jgi:hypothetical protein
MFRRKEKTSDKRELAAAAGFLLLVSICTAFAAAVNRECSRAEKFQK